MLSALKFPVHSKRRLYKSLGVLIKGTLAALLILSWKSTAITRVTGKAVETTKQKEQTKKPVKKKQVTNIKKQKKRESPAQKNNFTNPFQQQATPMKQKESTIPLEDDFIDSKKHGGWYKEIHLKESTLQKTSARLTKKIKKTHPEGAFLYVGFMHDLLSEYPPLWWSVRLGGPLAPQHIFEVGFNIYSYSLIQAISYQYEFIENGDYWVPGIGIDTQFSINNVPSREYAFKDGAYSLTHEDYSLRYLAIGIGLNLFLRRAVSKYLSVLLKAGLDHEPIRVNTPQFFSDVDVYFSFGVGLRLRWHP